MTDQTEDAKTQVRVALEPRINAALEKIDKLSSECAKQGFSGRLGLRSLDRYVEDFSDSEDLAFETLSNTLDAIELEQFFTDFAGECVRKFALANKCGLWWDPSGHWVCWSP